jgi:hypothetical protein
MYLGAHLHDHVTLPIFGVLFYKFLHFSYCSSLLGPNILLSPFFWNALNMCSCISVGVQVKVKDLCV